MIKVTKVEQVSIADTPHKIDIRKLYDTETAQVVHITLQPEETLKPHITQVDVFFYILEGMPDVRIGDEVVTVERDSIIESPKNIVHCIVNNSQV